jgi:hypothetical protein
MNENYFDHDTHAIAKLVIVAKAYLEVNGDEGVLDESEKVEIQAAIDQATKLL